jgi:hypothetical protein
MAFGGQGFVVIQPSESVVEGAGKSQSGSGGLTGLLGG